MESLGKSIPTAQPLTAPGCPVWAALSSQREGVWKKVTKPGAASSPGVEQVVDDAGTQQDPLYLPHVVGVDCGGWGGA